METSWTILILKTANIQLSYKSRIAFLFLVFTKGAEHAGGPAGVPSLPRRLKRGRHIHARPGPLSAGRGIAGVIQPGRDARGLSPPRGGDRPRLWHPPHARGMASP